METEKLKKYLEKFLASQNMLVLATCKGNVPRATPMDYYCDGLTIYIYPGPGKKIDNLKSNLIVSLAVFAPFSDGNVRGVQISSSKIKFLKKDDEGFKKAQNIYRWKNKKVLLKIVPEKIELLDFSLVKRGYDSRQELIL